MVTVEMKRLDFSSQLNDTISGLITVSIISDRFLGWKVATVADGCHYHITNPSCEGLEVYYADEFRLPWCEAFVPGFDVIAWIKREKKIRRHVSELFSHHAPYTGDEREPCNDQVEVKGRDRWVICPINVEEYRVTDTRIIRSFVLHRSLTYGADPSELVQWIRNECGGVAVAEE